jgi:hypothetical protein
VTTGVVSVLMASLIMPMVIAPPIGGPRATTEERNDPAVRAYSITAWASLSFSLAAILLSYLLLIELDQTADETDQVRRGGGCHAPRNAAAAGRRRRPLPSAAADACGSAPPSIATKLPCRRTLCTASSTLTRS